ncbi:hypothetical protein P4S72_30180 [Vibrio sp. PP-XX7]
MQIIPVQGLRLRQPGQWEAGKTLGLRAQAGVPACLVLPPSLSAGLSCAREPVHHCDAWLCSGFSNFGGRSNVWLLICAVTEFSESESYTLTALIYLVLAISMRQFFAWVKRVAFKNPSL